MSELAEASEEIATYLEFFIDGAMHAPDASGEASSADAVTTYYQAIGICELLLDAEVDAFFHHLIRSAQTRKWLLERSKTRPGYPAKVMRASNARGLFGAVAASQWDLARAIAALSPTVWSRDVEYEDDFCYAHFLHRYLLAAPAQELAGVLARFDAALEGGASVRLGLARALLARDADAIEEAFGAYLDDRAATLARQKKVSLAATEGLFLPMSSIDVEGLAWLALFRTAGVELGGEYPYCPSLARKRRYAPFQVTTFPAVPL